MPENRLPRKSFQYQPQGKRDLRLTVVANTDSCSCRAGIDCKKLQLEEEEEEEEEEEVFDVLHYAGTFHLLEFLAEAFRCHVHHFQCHELIYVFCIIR